MTDQDELKKLKKKISAAAYFKKRYAEDPEFRSKTVARSNAWIRANRELINERARERFKTDPEFRESQRANAWAVQWRRRGFDSAVEIYDRMLVEQNGLCATCKLPSDRRLCLDHCEVTKMLRSLLCHNCNLALGLLRHHSGVMRECAAYVDRWRAIHEAGGGIGPSLLPPERPRRAKSPSRRGPPPPAARRAVTAQQTQPFAPSGDAAAVRRSGSRAIRRRKGWTSPLV
jgi:Recombination endonuclease VII